MQSIQHWLIGMLKSPEIVAVLLTALIAFLIGRLRKGRLKWAVAHQHAFWLRAQPQDAPQVPLEQPAQLPAQQDAAPVQDLLIRTRQLWIQNTGRSAVRDVEVVLNYAPQHYELWPQRAYDSVPNRDGRLVIKVESLGPKEFFTLAMLDARMDLPEVMNLRSSDGTASQVAMAPQQIFSRTLIGFLWLLVFLGVFAAFYWSILLLQLLTQDGAT